MRDFPKAPHLLPGPSPLDAKPGRRPSAVRRRAVGSRAGAALLLVAVIATPAGTSEAWARADQRALDQLGPSHPAHSHASHGHHAAHHGHAAHANRTALAATAPPPEIPAAPPPPPVISAPVINVPLHPAPPPAPVPVVATAVGTASPLDGGSRITFGNGSADLNAATDQAVHAFAARLRATPEARAQINAYGSGTPDDPSTPRRLSLSRGLAARAILINDGVPSTRIYVRAIGQPHDGGPPDRADLILSGDTSSVADQTASGASKAATTP